MKKLVFIVVTALIIVGCEWKNPDGSYDTSKSLYLETIIIDSCEYVSGYYRLAHKGNCRFCKERRQKELKELLVEQLKEEK